MRKIVCSVFNNIYDAEIIKDGVMSDKNRRECTDECVDAVVEHLQGMESYESNGAAGYQWDYKDGHGHIRLMVYDDSKFELVEINHEDEKNE